MVYFKIQTDKVFVGHVLLIQIKVITINITLLYINSNDIYFKIKKKNYNIKVKLLMENNIARGIQK